MNLFSKKTLASLTAVGVLSFSQAGVAALSYSENFDSLVKLDPNALHPDESGWHIGNCNHDVVPGPSCWFGDGVNHNGAPNSGNGNTLNGYSSLVDDQGGPAQGANQLSVFSDYNPWSPFGTGVSELEAFVYDDVGTITADMAGNTYRFSFDVKEGNIGEGNATASAYLNVLQQTASFGTLHNVAMDTTNVGTDWSGGSVDVTIDAAWVGELLQVGFSNRTTASWEATGMYYDNLNFSEVPVPAAAWLFGSALLGLAGIGRKRRTA